MTFCGAFHYYMRLGPSEISQREKSWNFLSQQISTHRRRPLAKRLCATLTEPSLVMEFATTQSPVASEVFASVALFVISVIVLLILRHYLPLRTTPAYLLVPIFFALCLPASMVLLVPIDLASSAMVDDIDARGIWLERGPLRVCWRIAYWLTFCLTWCVLA